MYWDEWDDVPVETPVSDEVWQIRKLVYEFKSLKIKRYLLVVKYLHSKRASEHYIDNEQSRRKFRKIRRTAIKRLSKQKPDADPKKFEPRSIAEEIYRMASHYFNHNKLQQQRDNIVNVLTDDLDSTPNNI